MPRKTVAALLTQADATLPDNTTQDISPADVRQMIKDFLESYAPGFCMLSNNLLTLVAVPAAPPRVIIYTSLISQTPDFTSVLGAGSITRVPLGLPSTINRASFQATIGGASGAEAQFQLFRDGVAVPGAIAIITMQGATNRVQVTLIFADLVADGLSHTYDMRVSKLTGAAGDITCANARFTVEALPSLVP